MPIALEYKSRLGNMAHKALNLGLGALVEVVGKKDFSTRRKGITA